MVKLDLDRFGEQTVSSVLLNSWMWILNSGEARMQPRHTHCFWTLCVDCQLSPLSPLSLSHTHTHTHVLLTDGASVFRFGLFRFRFGGFTGWSGQAFYAVGPVWGCSTTALASSSTRLHHNIIEKIHHLDAEITSKKCCYLKYLSQC